jgi:hypothetical protein
MHSALLSAGQRTGTGETLLAKQQEHHLTKAERRELTAFLQECDAIMLQGKL